MSQPRPTTIPLDAPKRREKVRLRAAHVRQRLNLATDALAAADLLLGVNYSVAAVGRKESK